MISPFEATFSEWTTFKATCGSDVSKWRRYDANRLLIKDLEITIPASDDLNSFPGNGNQTLS